MAEPSWYTHCLLSAIQVWSAGNKMLITDPCLFTNKDLKQKFFIIFCFILCTEMKQ